MDKDLFDLDDNADEVGTSLEALTYDMEQQLRRHRRNPAYVCFRFGTLAECRDPAACTRRECCNAIEQLKGV